MCFQNSFVEFILMAGKIFLSTINCNKKNCYFILKDVGLQASGFKFSRQSRYRKVEWC